MPRHGRGPLDPLRSDRDTVDWDQAPPLEVEITHVVLDEDDIVIGSSAKPETLNSSSIPACTPP